MDRGTNSDLFFLHDEKFDFDVSLSPASSKGDEDEDEVFVGPVTHKERCVSVNVQSRLESAGSQASWSPLTGDQLEAVCVEAHRLASQLQSGEPSQPHSEEDTAAGVTPAAATDAEEFVQDTETKLGVLGQPASALSPIKRQTFCVQDSPMKQLPPAVQRRLLSRGSGTGTPSSGRPPSTRQSLANTNSFTRPAASARLSTSRLSTSRLSTSSPAGPKPQPRTGLRGKAPLGVGVVLPSKPAAPSASCPAGKSKVEKTKLQPPVKTAGGWKRSPSSQPRSRAESSEDLLSDSASVASDISDSSINSSLLGKRTLAPPTKGVVRNLSGVKAPRLQSRSVVDRKNTSSSSSSVSSFNSSMSLSPAKGKLNSSLNRSLSSSIGPAPSSISRPVINGRGRRSTVSATAEPMSTAAGRRSLSTQAKKQQQQEVERVKAAKATPLKKVEATPAKRVLEKTPSVPTGTSAQPQSGLKTKTKPEAVVAPTPSGVRRLSSRPDVSKVLKPKRLVSAGSLDSVPQKPVTAPLTPSAGSCRPMQTRAVRPTALPTPVRRRMSTIAVATPTNQSRLTRPQFKSDSDPAIVSTSADDEKGPSPTPSGLHEAEPDVPVIPSFYIEEDGEEEEVVEPPTAPSCSPAQADQSERMVDAGAPTQAKSEPNRNLIELETAEESNSKAQEVLLLDLPAPTLQPQEKLLIDLTNTPDLIRTNNKACTATQQLIDLSSPLIKWSPEDKRENNAPLINLSF